MQLSFERMAACHGPAIAEIFNYYIANSFAAYFEQPMPPVFFHRLLQATEGYPALVVLTESGQMAGFGFLRPIHPASTLRRTAEATYFLSPDFTRQGIGTALLEQLVEQAKPMGIDSLVASISSKNAESITFHKKNGFCECGRFARAGRKNGEEFDIVWMQRHL